MLRKHSFRKSPVAIGVSAAILAISFSLTGCDGSDGNDGTNGTNGTDGTDGTDGLTNYVPVGLKRLATAPLGAEFTGMYLNSDNTFFLNVQHPSSSNTTTDADGKVFDKGTVGVIVGQDFSALPSDFGALDLPINTADKEVVMTAVGSYQVLTQQNDTTIDGNQMGDILAANGTTLVKSSNDPDFNGVISDGGSGFYVYTNWEDRPGSMGRTHVDNYTLAGGYGTVTLDGMIDFSSVSGTWVNCFGTVSPWDTPLSSEELYFDDTADWFDSSYTYFSNPQAMATYLGYPTDGSGDWPNPYRYGYIVELTNPTDGVLANVVPNKLETLGRFSHENSVVMPDLKTVFLSDDGSGVVFFKFVADTAGDLSSGTLYGAKVTQTNGVSDPSEAAFAIEWVELANMTEADLETAIASFDGTFAAANYITDEEVCDWAESKTGTDLECDTDTTVDTNPYADDRVAFLESRKAAVALGATGEFRKMEGVNINFDLANAWWNAGAADGAQAYMYMAMSQFNSTMSDDEGDIQLDGTNGNCGVVYRMKLVQNANGDVDVTTMVPAIVGGPYYSDRSVNECNVNNISNPDNLVIMSDGRVLIGEDTGNHENNMIWVFDDPAL
jgi:secreted PhoX family phosphatase